MRKGKDRWLFVLYNCNHRVQIKTCPYYRRRGKPALSAQLWTTAIHKWTLNVMSNWDSNTILFMLLEASQWFSEYETDITRMRGNAFSRVVINMSDEFKCQWWHLIDGRVVCISFLINFMVRQNFMHILKDYLKLLRDVQLVFRAWQFLRAIPAKYFIHPYSRYILLLQVVTKRK